MHRLPPALHSRIGVALALVATLGASRVTAQSPRPAVKPPSDSVVGAVIALVQSGDAVQRRAFLARALSARARTSDSARIDTLIARLHEQGAPYVALDNEHVGPHVFARLRSNRASRVLRLQISTDQAQPGSLGTIDVLESHAAVLDNMQWPGTRLAGDAAIAAIIGRNLGRLSKANAFSGAVYVAHRDSVIFARAYGFADLEDSVPNTLHTRFAIASIGKMFTATAILQLVDAGKLRLSDTLARVLPAYPNADRAQRITIRQLLEHSAGLGDQWSTPPKPVPGLTGALAYAGAVAYPPLFFEPGTRWSYSNEGYSVLAAVIEQVTGDSFHDYLAEHVFAPAGMTETVLAVRPDDVVPHRAVGYRAREDDALGAGVPRANWSFLRADGAGGAGGQYSTVTDLARFARALRTGRLISPALRDSMWTGRWEIPGYEGERYGFASFVGKAAARIAVGHGGGGMGSGMDNGFRQFTDGSYTIVVLTNIDPPAATILTKGLVQLLAVQR